MRNLLRLIDCLKDPERHRWTSQRRERVDLESEAFWQESIKKSQVFVMDAIGEAELEERDGSAELDLPFECCSFEFLQEKGLAVIDTNSNEVVCHLHLMMVREISPRVYRILALNKRKMLSEGVERPFWQIIWSEPKDPDYKLYFSFVSRFLERLRLGSVGTEHVRQKVKIGTGSTKEFHTIRQIIRVLSKKEFGKAMPVYGREVDWSHRFRVRGHWRKIAGLGKDRAGQYTVSGFTWVVDFTKGPEDKPLIEKVRLVSNEK